MKRVCASPRFFLYVLASGFFLPPVAAQNGPPVREEIAKAYGFSSFGHVEQIRYTFNADLGEKKISRCWVWEPKTDRVWYEAKDKDGKPVKSEYLRSQIGSQPVNVSKEIDPAFINDHYWLFFPFHLIWDKGAAVEDKGMAKMPVGKGTARRIVVTYAKEGGYTPGDMYELFVGPDNLIRAWIYHDAGPAPKRSLLARWTANKKVGPLVVSTDHPGTREGGKPIRIFFTDVAAKLSGSGAWVAAH